MTCSNTSKARIATTVRSPTISRNFFSRRRRCDAQVDLVRFESSIPKTVERRLVDVEPDVLEPSIPQRLGSRRVAAADVEHHPGLGVALVEQRDGVGVAGVRFEVAWISLLT